jgi:hypothetical protein
MATDYSSENPHGQLAKLRAEQPHVERLTEAASMWERAQHLIRSARVELLGRTNALEGSWRDDAGQAFGARVDESVNSLKAWYEKIEGSGVIGHAKALQSDFPNCVAQVQKICEQFEAAAQAQASGGMFAPDQAYLEREYAKLAAQFTNHIADRFDAVTRAMDNLAGQGPAWEGPREEGNGDLTERILANARGEIGVKEDPSVPNKNPYGPTDEWCSYFATEMWRRAGVDVSGIPKKGAFTGDVYTWGEANGKAYDKNHFDQIRPGDMLIVGTGPQNTNTSEHIGIVESVDLEAGTVNLISGNSGANIDEVTIQEYPLSEFYGGVHP